MARYDDRGRLHSLGHANPRRIWTLLLSAYGLSFALLVVYGGWHQVFPELG